MKSFYVPVFHYKFECWVQNMVHFITGRLQFGYK